MGKFNAVHIHAAGLPVEQLFEEVEAFFVKEGFEFYFRYHEELPWVQVTVNEAGNVPRFAFLFSTQWPKRRVIGLAATSAETGLGYWEFKGGSTVRSLVYGLERQQTWEQVKGHPSPWEREIFPPDVREIIPGESVPTFTMAQVRRLGQMMEFPGFGLPLGKTPWTAEISLG